MVLCKDCIHKLVSANILPEYFHVYRTCFAQPIDAHLEHCHECANKLKICQMCGKSLLDYFFEVIENIYISASISHLYLQKPEFTPYNYWLIVF